MAGSRRGRFTTMSRRATSDLSIVTMKKNRKAETALLMRRLRPALRLLELEAAQVFCHQANGE